MKQSSAKERLRGKEGFEKYYFERFGQRWQALRAALLEEGTPVMWQAGNEQSCNLPCLPYYMDRASIMAAASLPSGGHNILDMCAAPGGKSLVIASLMENDAHLTCNDSSLARYKRLVKTLDSCLPLGVRRRVSATCKDAASLCRRATASYDRILLDSPCSSERHVMTDAKYISLWTPARIKSLAMTQWALISSAWRMLEAGGCLLYCTCALCHEENDIIIERLLRKFSDARVIGAGDVLRALDDNTFVTRQFLPRCPDCRLPSAERTRYGLAILPDTSGGAGPMYFASVRKSRG